MRSRGAFAWVARTSSSEKGLYAISPLFDRARRIAPGEVPEDVAEKGAQGGGERAGAAGVVGAVEHEPSAGAREDLEAPRPPRAPEPVADRRIADAELTGRGHGEQSVLGLVAPEHAEPQVGDGPAGSGAADQLPVETTVLDRDGQIAPREQQG